MKYPTKASIEGLKQKISFPALDVHSQDWEYEVADASRLNEFLNFYFKPDFLSKVERFTLMIVILESFNDALTNQHQNENDWANIQSALLKESDLHTETIEKFASRNEEDLEMCFAITSRIRILFPEEKSKTGGQGSREIPDDKRITD